MTQTVILQGVDKEQNIYKEITPGGYGIAIKTKDILFSEQSKFQKVEIFDTDSTLGRVLTLDELMMTTEGDEFHYHEMIAHIPMMQHPCPKTVLVIGGGDTGQQVGGKLLFVVVPKSRQKFRLECKCCHHRSIITLLS